MPKHYLKLQETTVIKILDYGGLLIHITAAGVDVHTMDGERLAFAALANVTCGAVNDNGVFLGTVANGVYKLTHAAIAAGGDQTGALSQTITTGTTPALASNAVAWIAGSGTALLVTTEAGADYLPNASTVYRYSDASGCAFCAIGSTQIAYSLADGTLHFLTTPATDWTSGDVTSYPVGGGTPELTKLSAVPYAASVVRGCAWSGDYLAVAHDGSPGVKMYKKSGEALSLVDSVAHLAYNTYCVAWNGDYLVAGYYDSNRLALYLRSGDDLVKQTDPSACPNRVYGVAWGGDYLAVAMYGGYLWFFKLDAGALTKLTTPTAPPGTANGCAWSGDYLAVAHKGGSGVSLYKRSGDTLTLLANPPDTGGDGMGCSWSGDYLAVATNTSPYLAFYKRSGDTLTKLTNPTSVGGLANSCSWNGDYLAVAYATSPYLAFYERSGDTLVKRANPTALDGTGYHCDWGGDYLAAVHSGSPGVSWYRGPVAGLPGAVTALSFGSSLFIGTQNGISIEESGLVSVTDIGSVLEVSDLQAGPSATSTSGLLAYSTDDGQGGGKFAIRDMSA
jgi:hypothetical protein